MIIEGDSTRLANIIFKFRNDDRLKDFNMITKEQIDQPEFTSWGVKILKQGGDPHDRIHEKIFKTLKGKLHPDIRSDTTRLSAFLQNLDDLFSPHAVKADYPSMRVQAQTQASAPKAEPVNFSGQMISLSGWPRPGKVKMNPELMKICALLVGRPRRYDDLLSVKVVVSEATLVGNLQLLHNLGILKKHPIDGKPELVSIPGSLPDKPKPKSNDRFSAVLKNFLSASKH